MLGTTESDSHYLASSRAPVDAVLNKLFVCPVHISYILLLTSNVMLSQYVKSLRWTSSCRFSEYKFVHIFYVKPTIFTASGVSNAQAIIALNMAHAKKNLNMSSASVATTTIRPAIKDAPFTKKYKNEPFHH